MKVLVKLGGALLDDAAKLFDVARQLAQAARKADLLVVHGGGKQVTRFLEERGVESRFIGGLRVSDERVIDAVTKVIAGGINKQLVAAICAAGQPAVGLSGIDGLLTNALPIDPALQFVGKPQKTDGRLLSLLSGAGYLPVVACIAADARGNIYNVNADQMAVSCALGWGVEKLLFLTDVAGVKDGKGTILPNLTADDVRDLVGSGVAHGGMQAKLEAAVWALQGGVSEVVIAPGQEPDACLRLLSGETFGTRLILREVLAESAVRLA